MRILSQIIALMLVALSAVMVNAQDFDPNSSKFDPEKQFSITSHGAIMGDPVQLKVLGKDKIAYTVVTVTPTVNGIQTILSLIEPQQDGEPGGGHALMMSLLELEHFMMLLNETKNADVSSLSDYGENHKLVGRVKEPDDASGEIAVLFNKQDIERKQIRIVQILGGTPTLFEFTTNGIEKLLQQIGHFVEKMEAGTEATKL